MSPQAAINTVQGTCVPVYLSRAAIQDAGRELGFRPPRAGQVVIVAADPVAKHFDGYVARIIERKDTVPGRPYRVTPLRSLPCGIPYAQLCEAAQ